MYIPLKARYRHLVGKKFAHNTIIRILDTRTNNGKIMCEYKCDCGTVCTGPVTDLVCYRRISCGRCSFRRTVTDLSRRGCDLTGRRFGKLIVLKQLNKRSCGHVYMLCKCDCGNVVEILRNSLVSNRTKSCGKCGYISTVVSAKNRKYVGVEKHLSRLLSKIKQRCYNPNAVGYKYWGGRGIKVCDEWMNDTWSFINWSLSHGYTEDPKVEIDRIDNNGAYSPDNCRWVTRIVQANNKSNNRYITADGRTHTLAEWARLLDINYFTLRSISHEKVSLFIEDIIKSRRM